MRKFNVSYFLMCLMFLIFGFIAGTIFGLAIKFSLGR
jgi:NADH:ubiquinone oxidoreductase subunit 3 (subunit A)